MSYILYSPNIKKYYGGTSSRIYLVADPGSAKPFNDKEDAEEVARLCGKCYKFTVLDKQSKAPECLGCHDRNAHFECILVRNDTTSVPIMGCFAKYCPLCGRNLGGN